MALSKKQLPLKNDTVTDDTIKAKKKSKKVAKYLRGYYWSYESCKGGSRSWRGLIPALRGI